MNGGMNHEIASLGLEREELGKDFNALIGGERIPYVPRDLASIVTLLRPYNIQRYLAIEGVSAGGWRYIGKTCAIPEVVPLDNRVDLAKALRSESACDLISIDPRELDLNAEEIWRFILGGKEEQKAFGKGAPKNYGASKLKPKTLIIFNFSDAANKNLYFRLRTYDNKIFQSKWVGMLKWN